MKDNKGHNNNNNSDTGRVQVFLKFNSEIRIYSERSTDRLNPQQSTTLSLVLWGIILKFFEAYVFTL